MSIANTATPISTYGATLTIGSSEYAIKSFPDLFGEPNTIDVTTLSNSMQTYILGIKQSSVMSFPLNFDKTTFTALKGSENTAGTSYVLTLSDGSTFTWTGMHSVSVAGKGVDEAIEFNVNIVATTEIVFAAGS